VAHQESLVHAGSPVAASVDVLPRATGGPGITGDSTGNGGDSPTPTPEPTPAPDPDESPTSTRTLIINLATASPGYANLTLGEGTTPGVVTVTVEGRSATIAVGGPTTTRVDFAATAGTHTVTITSTGQLGSVSLDVPGSGTTTPTPTPVPNPGSTQHLTVTLAAPSPGYAVITLPVGTTAGVVTVTVEGRSATIAIRGPTTARVDFTAGVGTHDVTISSTGTLGSGVTLKVS
ncbi:MAG: hypothetical protein VW239_07950, partial [Candidatus Nanopelagicales bacterium]